MTAVRDRNKFRGCLVGGAIGDALGYAVEFLSLNQIRAAYGPKGITEYELVEGTARISDDTQMTLFTANGLLIGPTRGAVRGIAVFCALRHKDNFRDADADEVAWTKKYFSNQKPSL